MLMLDAMQHLSHLELKAGWRPTFSGAAAVCRVRYNRVLGGFSMEKAPLAFSRLLP
jgi:hypothetical protein